MDCSCGHDHHGHDHDHDHHHHHGNGHDHPHDHGPLWQAGEEARNFEDASDETAHWHEKHIFKLLDDGIRHVAEDRPLKEILRALSNAMRAADPRIEALFLPGLEESALAAAWTQQSNPPLPDDVRALYGWHNGVDEQAEELFKGYKFLPLDDVLAVRAMMGDPDAGHYLPIMQDIFGCAVFVDLRGDRRNGLVYETTAENFCSPNIYPGLSAYFAAMLACFDEGAFAVEKDADDGDADVLIGKHARIRDIFSRYALRPKQQSSCQSCADMTAALSAVKDGPSELDHRISLGL